MLLALDLRNGAVNAGFRNGSGWAAIYRFGPDRSADEYAFALEAAAAKAGAGVDSCWISSVVPALGPRLAQAVASCFGIEATPIGPGVRTGVKIRTDNPAEVGSDLVCAAAAAWQIAGGASVVVDFGLALTFVAVNGSGELLGAAIVPGPESAADALRSSAAQLPEVRLDAPERAIGRNTVQSVRSGIVLGYGGLVERVVERMKEELGPAVVIGSGDPIGIRLLEGVAVHSFHPHLALDGLAIIAARNGSQLT